MICFTESELQQHEELIITRALAAKDLALAQANRHKEELFQKLAEKDREIQQIREHEFQRGYREGVAAMKEAMNRSEDDDTGGHQGGYARTEPQCDGRGGKK